MNDVQPTVFVVDDDAAILKALGRLLRSAGLNAATFASPQAFLDHYKADMPGCLVLDVSMPELYGLELQSLLTARGLTPPVIFLTGHGDIPTSVKAMKQGASDFLTKPVHEDDLLAAIHTAIAQDTVQRLAQAELADVYQRLATLTPREREVMQHVVSGKLNKQIATELGTVEKTIKVHRAHIMEKLKVHSLAELVRLSEKAKRNGT